MIRLTATGPRGSWMVHPHPSIPNRWEVLCNGLAVAVGVTCLHAWGTARERSGYHAREWVDEETCKRCQRWHVAGQPCPHCAHERGPS
jgi:hypothetical protein